MKMVELGKALPYLRGQNLLSPRSWRIRVLDALHRTPTIQLKYKLEVYQLNPKDKAEFDDLNALGKVEEANTLLFVRGILKSTTGEKNSRSFVLQWLQWIEATIARPTSGSSDTVTIKRSDASNSNITNTNILASFAVEAPSTNDFYGILVGTGITAPATADYVMQTKVAHGSAGTQLNYNPTSVGAASVVGANVDLTIVRTFNNGSGGTITLKEIGLALYLSASLYFLATHDAVNQAILNTEVAVVSYTMRTTV